LRSRLVQTWRGFSPDARRLLVYSFLGFVAFAVFGLIFNLYMSALGFRNDVIGLFNALPAAVVLLVGLPMGALADRFGYRAFILVAAAGGVVGAIALGLVSAPLPAVLAAGLFALSTTVLGVLGAPLLAQLSRPDERVVLYSVQNSLAWVGNLLGYLVGGYVPELNARLTHIAAGSAPSLRRAFLVMAVLEVISVPFVVQLAASPRLRASAALPVRMLLQVDWRRFLRVLIPQALLGIGAGMLLNFLQLYLAQRFHLTPGPIGLVLAVGALLATGVTLTVPAVSRVFGITRTIGVSQLCGAPLILVIAFSTSLPLAILAIYVRQSFLNIQAPLSQLFGMEVVSEQERARMASAQNVVFSLGFAGLGPLISGLLQVRGGFQLAFSVSALFYLLAGTSFLVLFGRLRLPSERLRGDQADGG
jgi:MFS family permease